MSGQLEEILAHKATGNDAYKAGDMAEAIRAYSLAVNILPNLADDDDSSEEDEKDAGVLIADVEPDVAKQGARCRLPRGFSLNE